MTTRFVVLGLDARPESWFRAIADSCTPQDSNVEFLPCRSVAELRAHLDTGRRYSALLIGRHDPDLDCDLIDLARRRRCAVILAASSPEPIRCEPPGIAGVLAGTCNRNDLLALLSEVATPVPEVGYELDGMHVGSERAPWSGRLVAVCGTGGTGASTAARTLARGLGSPHRDSSQVLLADLALDADQAMWHAIEEVAPAVPELIDAHRRPWAGQISARDFTFAAPRGGYRLLLGLRDHAEWVVLRPRATQAALVSLTNSFDVVVADVDADVEGEAQCGVIEIEDRNLLARTTLGNAEVVVVVASPTAAGLRALSRVVRRLLRFGTAPESVLCVVNRVADDSRDAHEIARTLMSSIPALEHPPVFVPDCGDLDAMGRGDLALPDRLCEPLISAVHRVLDRPVAIRTPTAPPRVRPGSGSWSAPETTRREVG